MQNGSKTVQIGGQEVMLKDSSFYKSSPLGNEAATNGQGAGVITHVITRIIPATALAAGYVIVVTQAIGRGSTKAVRIL